MYTELEIVNSMLAAVGTAPLPDLTNPNSETQLAQAAQEACADVLSGFGPGGGGPGGGFGGGPAGAEG